MNRRRQSVYVAYAVLALVIVPFGYFYLFLGVRFFRVPSVSMVPTLEIADYLVTVPDTAYEPGDIVVLHDPDVDGQYLVKRIVAIENSVVRAQGGGLFVNGRYVSEPYLYEPMRYDMAEYTVPPDSVFVLGDNRNQSEDSHNWDRDPDKPNAPGKPRALPRDQVIGRVVAIYLPFDRIQRIRSYRLEDLRAG